MHYVGLDVHYRQSTLAIVAPDGRHVKTATVRGGWSKLVTWIEREVPVPFSICFEASCGCGALHRLLSPRAARVVVAHAGHLQSLVGRKRKTDRLDARKLASLLLLDLVPSVYVPSAEVQGWREMIRMRRGLIEKRTRVKNEVRSLLRNYGRPSPRRLWNGKGLAWLAALEWPSPTVALRLELLLEQLRHLDGQVARVTSELDCRARREPVVGLLRTIPGVGPRTAEAVAAWIDDPDRFGRAAQVGSYFGLVPCQDQSAGQNRLGHITRQGPSVVRRLLTEASWQAVRRSPTVRRRFEHLCGGRTDRRKIAIVAVGRWLAVCMAKMLKTGECWREDVAATVAA